MTAVFGATKDRFIDSAQNKKSAGRAGAFQIL
jgi:hypothetical protein